VLGTQVVKVFDLAAGHTGLRDADARACSVESNAEDHKANYPGAHSIRIRITADAATRRLLGVQMVGHKDAAVAKRIDIAATVIHHHMTANDLADLDLSYTPPLGSLWDAVQTAAHAWNAPRTNARPATSLIQLAHGTDNHAMSPRSRRPSSAVSQLKRSVPGCSWPSSSAPASPPPASHPATSGCSYWRTPSPPQPDWP
jgi:hypothetical protein